jgi:hypothetical protein
VSVATMTTTWEYLTIHIPHPRLQAGKMNRKDIDKRLAEAGQDGWEAYSFFPDVNLAGERDGALILCKRPAR